MAKTESTAVNNLIDLVHSNQRSSKPIVHPDDDLFATPPSAAKPNKKTPAKAMPVLPQPRMSAAIPSPSGGTLPPLPRTRSAGGTSQHTLPEHMPQARMSTAPPTRGTTIPPIPQRGSAPVFPAKVRTSEPRFTPVQTPVIASAQGTPAPELVNPLEPYKSPTAPVNPSTFPMPNRIDMTGDAVMGENWFEASRAVEKFEEETYVGTAPHIRHEREASASMVKKLILPAIGFMIVGALIGGFIAFNGDKKQAHAKEAAAPAQKVVAQPTAANTQRAAEIANGANTDVVVQKIAEPVAQPVEAPATQPANPAIHDVQTTRGVVHLADVRIDSKPSGANVTLVEPNGKKSFLGTTPLATSLDASHAYDLEVALANHPDQTVHFDPASTQHVELELAKKAPAPAHVAAPVHHAAPVAKAHHVAAAATTKPGELADPGFDSAPAEKPEAPAAAATGTLMVSTKPPCEILIDGKATGLSTPQKLPLSVGAHKVTLVNGGASINKTVMVQINADQPTKLVKDLLAN